MAAKKYPKKGAQNSSTKWVVMAIAAVIVVAAGIALVSGGDSSGNVSSSTTAAASAGTVAPTDSLPATVSPAEYQPVQIIGDALPPMPESGDDAGIGAKVPVVKGFNFRGDPVTLDVPSVGKPTMVVFLAHWCPHCNREIPRILELNSQGGIPADLRVVGVATGSRDDQANWPPSEWLAETGWKWEKLADTQNGDAFAAYGGMSFPTMVLVGPDGTVVDRFSGEMEVADLGARISAFMEKVSKA